MLEGLFDYAGMFPPAQRSFTEMLHERSSFSKTLQRPWLVAGDFVLDTKHAKQLAHENLAALGFQRDVSVCLLVSEGPAEALATARLLRATSTPEIAFSIASIEARCVPERIEATLAELGPYADSLHALVAIEVDLSIAEWRDALSLALAALSRSPYRTALKCRSTGPTGIGPDRCAAAVAATCDARVGLKFTGGFHHPIVEPSRHQYPMGFLNLAAAVMFRRILKGAASEEILAALLVNQSRTELHCLEGLHFRSLHISHAQLQEAKAQASFSIGSCSIHEPDEDLLRLFGST